MIIDWWNVWMLYLVPPPVPIDLEQSSRWQGWVWDAKFCWSCRHDQSWISTCLRCQRNKFKVAKMQGWGRTIITICHQIVQGQSIISNVIVTWAQDTGTDCGETSSSKKTWKVYCKSRYIYWAPYQCSENVSFRHITNLSGTHSAGGPSLCKLLQTRGWDWINDGPPNLIHCMNRRFCAEHIQKTWLIIEWV